jgi:hypothetical protein
VIEVSDFPTTYFQAFNSIENFLANTRRTLASIPHIFLSLGDALTNAFACPKGNGYISSAFFGAFSA